MRKRLRYRDLVERGVVRNRPTLQNWIRNWGFPPGQLTGPNTRTWGEDEIQEYLDSRPSAPKPAPPIGENKRRGRPLRSATP
jgi:predicted DNA-binding transcriptional regulator AlpA